MGPFQMIVLAEAIARAYDAIDCRPMSNIA
jgi:hypothetical protein